MSNIKKWEIFAGYFNEQFRFTRDFVTDKQKLAGKYTAIIKDAKKEENVVRRKAMLEVAKIVKSIME